MYRLLPADVITLATQGDTEAVLMVLTHYKDYIAFLARRYGYYDVEAECHMQSKLQQAILKFKLK